MSKFLNLCEQVDPANDNPKWDLIDFLKSKGVNVSLVKNTDMLYIDTGTKTIAVTISNATEDAESLNVGFGDYGVDSEVEKLGNTAASGLKGLAARGLGTAAQQAKQAVKRRGNAAKKAVPVYNKATERLERSLQQAQRQTTPLSY